MKGFFRTLLGTNSALSSMRYVMVFGVLFVVTAVFGTWGAVSLLACEINDIPVGVVTITVAVLGVLITGKVTQAIWGEDKEGQDCDDK